MEQKIPPDYKNGFNAALDKVESMLDEYFDGLDDGWRFGGILEQIDLLRIK